MNDIPVLSTIDTGSDINVVQERALKKYNFGRMNNVDFPFDGVGSKNRALGYFDVKIKVDNDIYDDYCFVMRDQASMPELIIGLSLINQTEMIVNTNGVTLRKIKPNCSEITELKEVCESKDPNEWNLAPMCALIMEAQSIVPELCHIQNKKVKDDVEKLVIEYEPKKVKNSPIELKIILNDETPIYQRPRYHRK